MKDIVIGRLYSEILAVKNKEVMQQKYTQERKTREKENSSTRSTTPGSQQMIWLLNQVKSVRSQNK